MGAAEKYGNNRNRLRARLTREESQKGFSPVGCARWRFLVWLSGEWGPDMPATITAREKREERAKLIKEARDINDKAVAENRELTAEEQDEFDRRFDAGQTLLEEAERMEKREANAARLAQAEEGLRESAGRQIQPFSKPHAGESGANQPYTYKLVRRSEGRQVTHDLQFGVNSLEWQRHQVDNRNAFRSYLRGGQADPNRLAPYQAALRTDDETMGGYLTVPEEMVGEFLRNVDDEVMIRRLARTFTTNAQSLGVVKRTAKTAAFAWGQELTDVETTEDSSYRLGARSLTPHYMTGMIKVSRDLMRSATMSPEEIVNYEMVRDAGELEENAFLTGSGAQQPLGLFTASADGISTGRDVSTGNTTTTIGADNLRECYYTLKGQYLNDASLRWLLHRLAIKQIAKLKTGDGQYLWEPGITGSPTGPTIMGVPVVADEFAPSTFTTGLYVGMLGAFRFYWIVDALAFEMLRLNEKYATTNQVGFIARRKVDGQPQLEEAFVRMKLA